MYSCIIYNVYTHTKYTHTPEIYTLACKSEFHSCFYLFNVRAAWEFGCGASRVDCLPAVRKFTHFL